MSFPNFWRMSRGTIFDGVIAINKPTGISSAQAVRDLQSHFDPSDMFSPWIQAETRKRANERPNQRNRRRQKIIQVKIGHGGTLDPLATGVLITGIGKGTKKLETFLKCTKTYETVVLFGAATDTYDRDGCVLKRAPYQHITRDMVESALSQFRGQILQLPPLYSALKMNGKPLYEYARQGKEIPREIEKRLVDVKELEMLEWLEGGTHKHKCLLEEAPRAEKDVAEKFWQSHRIPQKEAKRKLDDNQDNLVGERPISRRKSAADVSFSTVIGTDQESSAADAVRESLSETPKKDVGPPAARLRMTVTSGFYVRSLCHDLGQAVGSNAVMAELVRSRQGQFELGKNVLEYSDFAGGETAWGPKVQDMLRAWAKGEEERGDGKSPNRAKVGGKSMSEADIKGEEERGNMKLPNTAKVDEKPTIVEDFNSEGGKRQGDFSIDQKPTIVEDLKAGVGEESKAAAG